MDNFDEDSGYDIAIVGMAIRVPGALSPEQYWDNLINGVESVSFYSDEDLKEKGVSPEHLANPHYVKAGAPLEDVAGFDPDFFGFSPKEAAILDPQHRQFYECAWEALERAGHTPEQFDGAIGVFAGCGMGSYFAKNILSNQGLIDSTGLFLLRHTGNDKDFLSTRVSYNFNLKGPSINVQTACSTSSVATHLACQSLLSGESDMALAGGVTLEIPHGIGYHYKEGEILSPDGHCRPFDHRSKGTIFGSGTGVIVLRRLEDAIEDGDHIHAIISGSAVNNDGSSKVGYLAPSVEGQAQAITEALAVANVEADDISYVECHGTGTPVGDPIEVAALTQAFRQTSERNGFCGIGSVKSNIGHLDTAAGIAGIIKTALSLEHKCVPPSINYEKPNPTIDFESSPFYVNHQSKPLANDVTNRAAVNSLGVGGTNAFLILEEPPKSEGHASSARKSQLLVLSGKSRNAVDGYANKLATQLEKQPDINLDDVAYSLYKGRRHFEHRRVLACNNINDCIELLKTNSPQKVFNYKSDDLERNIVFMLPGGGAQYVEMSKHLYQTESVFKENIDLGLNKFEALSGINLKTILFPDNNDLESASEQLQKPSLQLPAIFIVEYALAQLWISFGVTPKYLIGHSMGENTAACIAGVMSFNDTLGLVHLRGTLMDTVPEGGMLSVELPASELSTLIGSESQFPDLDLASVNSPSLSVASGPTTSLNLFADHLAEKGIKSQKININIAAHSSMLDGILEPFRNYLESISLSKPTIPFISNRTGSWIKDHEATAPEYWVQHLRNTVHFAEGIDTLLDEHETLIFLEVGPGNTLGSLTRQNPKAPSQRVYSSLRHSEQEINDADYFLTVLGRVWAAGANVDLNVLWPEPNRKKIPLATYAFQHKDFWINPDNNAATAKPAFSQLEKIDNIDRWYRKPTWIQKGVLPTAKLDTETWLIFSSEHDLVTQLSSRLQDLGHNVITVLEGDAYYKINESTYRLSPESGEEGYKALIYDLIASGTIPNKILHCWLYTEDEYFRPGSSFFHRNQEYGFYSLFFLAKAIANSSMAENPLHISVLSNGMQRVLDEPLPYPEKSTVLGACKVIPREFNKITCSSIDLEPYEKTSSSFFTKNNKATNTTDSTLLRLLTIELQQPASNEIIAYRDNSRWAHCYGEVIERKNIAPRIKNNGTYLITGGLGGIGYVIATELAKNYSANLVLINRTPIPPRSQWGNWLKQHSHNDKISQYLLKIAKLEDAGAKTLVLDGDVTDVTRFKSIIEESKNKFGSIDGVFHAAGHVQDNLIQVKNQSEVEDVFAPKVYGTLVLDEVFKDESLDFMVLFSSTSTAIAPIGQIDYVAANCYLNAYADSKNTANNSRYTIAVNWGIWNEVGMAAESANSMGLTPSADKSIQEETNYILFEEHSIVHENTDLKHLFTTHISPKTHWLLDEHRTSNNQAILPGTAYIELARAALAEVGESKPFEISNLLFLHALYVDDDKSVKIRIKLERSKEGYDYKLQSLQSTPNGPSGWVSHAEAKLIIRDTPPTAKTEHDLLSTLKQLKIDKDQPAQSFSHIATSQENHLNFGPRWNVLRQLAYGKNYALGQLYLDDKYSSDLSDFYLHPGLLDIATGFAMSLISGYDSNIESSLWVPVSYKSIKYYKPLTQELYSIVTTPTENSIDKDFASFDISLFDKTGSLLVLIKQLTIHKLSGEIDFSLNEKQDNLKIEPETQTNSGEIKQLSPSELAFKHNLSQGILPNEGIKALTEILNSSDDSQIIISSLPLEGLIAEAEATTATLDSKTDSASFSRPDLDNDYVEPETDIEKTLVGFWQDLLGVDKVGVEDSFFDLGGHSLVAVRLFSKIQQTYKVDYPISVLFEAPTIRQCANLIKESSGITTVENDSEKDSTTASRYTHLVPMHQGKPESKASPFFLVAGMFGNVLNLRHLAHLIGNDRPFYGLQARGLYGDQEPHETFEEMATAYIKELKSIQPEGPYYLGGFSGGGITAFEIARQLKEAGDEIAILVFLDTPLAHSEPLSSVDRMSIHWQRINKKGLSYFTEWAKSRYHWELHKFQKRFSSGEQTDIKPYDFQSKNIELAFYRALSKYKTDHLPIKAILFRPKLEASYSLSGGRLANEVREIIQEDNGWTPYVKELKIYEVPGNHDSMVLEPNVRVLATLMSESINDAEGDN